VLDKRAIDQRQHGRRIPLTEPFYLQPFLAGDQYSCHIMFHTFFTECIPACSNTRAGPRVVKIAYFRKDFF
jgi:hypothetical protein